jgi:diacylglycerol kinase family enzyme
MRRVGVISNPLSGGNRKGLNPVRNVLAEHSQGIHREVRTMTDVHSALVDFARHEVDVLVVNGGDGTVHAVLTALFLFKPFETLPLLAILRSGTDSMIAMDIGIPGKREDALRKLLAWSRTQEGHPQILQRPVLRVQPAPDASPLFGMFFGTAGIYQGIQFCAHQFHTRGLRGEWADGLTLAWLLLELVRFNSPWITPVPITIRMDQNPSQEGDILALFVTTLERLFLGLRPFWGVENGPLHFTAVQSHPRRLFRTLPALLQGRRTPFTTPENGYFSHNLHEVQLTLTGGFTIDGELYAAERRSGPLSVQYGGQALFIKF